MANNSPQLYIGQYLCANHNRDTSINTYNSPGKYIFVYPNTSEEIMKERRKPYLCNALLHDMRRQWWPWLQELPSIGPMCSSAYRPWEIVSYSFSANVVRWFCRIHVLCLGACVYIEGKLAVLDLNIEEKLGVNLFLSSYSFVVNKCLFVQRLAIISTINSCHLVILCINASLSILC